MEFYAAERRKELIPFAMAWMELESIMLSEISQAVRDKYHMILLSFKSSLYVVDNSPLLDMSIANIFFQSVAGLILLIFSSEQMCFNCNEVQHIHSFFSWVMLLALHLKSHHCT